MQSKDRGFPQIKSRWNKHVCMIAITFCPVYCVTQRNVAAVPVSTLEHQLYFTFGALTLFNSFICSAGLRP